MINTDTRHKRRPKKHKHREGAWRWRWRWWWWWRIPGTGRCKKLLPACTYCQGSAGNQVLPLSTTPANTHTHTHVNGPTPAISVLLMVWRVAGGVVESGHCIAVFCYWSENVCGSPPRGRPAVAVLPSLSLAQPLVLKGRVTRPSSSSDLHARRMLPTP